MVTRRLAPGRPGTPGKGPQRGPKIAQVPIRPQAGASGINALLKVQLYAGSTNMGR